MPKTKLFFRNTNSSQPLLNLPSFSQNNYFINFDNATYEIQIVSSKII